MIEIVGGVDHGGSAHALAIIVDKDIAHYRENPTLEVGVLGILVLIVEGLEGSVLKEIVGIVTVGGEHVCEIKHIVLQRHQIVLECFGSHNS